MSTTIITGGTGGIGAETAALLLAQSPEHHVALVDRNAVAPELLAKFRDRVHCFACDVGDPESVDRTRAQIEQECPPVTSLVNAAGIVHNAPSAEISLSDFSRMQAVHVHGTLLWSQALVTMLDDRPGVIVNIGSIAGQFGHPRRIAYAAAKAAIHSMTKTLAVEWAARGIRVNAVAPGYIDTPMMQEVARIGLVDNSVAAGYAAMKRLGTPHEVAHAIAFLLGDHSSFITGQILNVDGGFAVLKAE
jgi:NAD(P)-dependent dehydrogenase (short-subunit alcohol dehydrogenase family)